MKSISVAVALNLLASSVGLAPAQQLVQDAQEQAPTPSLPPEELHIRTGIIILGNLYNALASVSDKDSAQAAVPTVMRLSRELQAWAQGVSALPPLSDEAKLVYEKRYMSAIERLNDHLRAQGERLAASDYFGSQDLSTALISLYISVQQ